MRIMMTDCPKSEKFVEMSVTANPVIQTALVAIKKASTKLRGACIVVLGNISRNAPNTIKPKKLTTNKMVGSKYKLSKNRLLRDSSDKKMMAIPKYNHSSLLNVCNSPPLKRATVINKK